MTDLRTEEPFGSPAFATKAEAAAMEMLVKKLRNGFEVCAAGSVGSESFHVLIRKPFGDTGVDEFRASFVIRPIDMALAA